METYTVPKADQYIVGGEALFKVTLPHGPGMRVSYRDLRKDLTKLYRCELYALATLLKVPQPYKMNKAELLMAVQLGLQFEE
jgi:hypothetical protein